MSYPYPQDRARDKRTKGDEPYEDAREAYGEKAAEIERAAPEPEGPAERRTDAEQARDAEDRFEQIGEDVTEGRGDADKGGDS